VRRDPLWAAAALSVAFAIAAGAFGAHAATGPAVDWLKTGGLYQMSHGVAALLLADRARRPAWVMLGGSALFAFSLYALALGAPRWAGAITPVGGSLMILAWIGVAFSRAR
jgi:uncharacterized membrane protein YgdD (TMEM256/DUF423 family)